FDIPEAIAARILPDDSISVNALLDFSLPRPVTALENPDAVFFTKSSPAPIDESSLLRLRHLDLPPVQVIRRLAVDGKQAWLDGFMSVKYGHIKGETLTHFPLWIITFWNEVIDTRLNVRKPWTHAKDWVKQQLQQRKRPDDRKLATETSRLLGIIPWKAAKRGLSDKEPMYTLWRYLGPTWLSATDENDMLE
ncbi:hypothetical protein K438DRAFT_1428875, partial [Mycena galopus ATCC 62051]